MAGNYIPGAMSPLGDGMIVQGEALRVLGLVKGEALRVLGFFHMQDA